MYLTLKVGVPLNDEVITHLNRRVNDTSAQLLFLERNLAETCTQVQTKQNEHKQRSIIAKQIFEY